jgi:hypothetical protein
MRSEEQQLEGLKIVAQKVVAQVCNCSTFSAKYNDVMDVACLVADEVDNPSEIVYAVDGYDVWKEGKPVQFNLTAEQAAEIVIREYKQAKIERIMVRMYGPNWRKHRKKLAGVLAYITAQVEDVKAEKERSEKARGKVN